MRTNIFAVVLVILGIMMFVYTGIDFITTKKVVDLGPIKIDRAEDHPVHWSPIVGAVMLVAGVAVLIRGRKGERSRA